MAIVLSKPKNHIAMEVIDFQNNSFGIELETLVVSLVDKIKNNIYKKDTDVFNSDEVDHLVKVIFNRTGIRVTFYTNRSIAAILPFYSNIHNILLDKFSRGFVFVEDQEKILNKSNNKKGYVDLAKAKVGGIFSEYENHLFINFKELSVTYGLTSSEIVAVILHELGHAFYVCEYADRLESNNQVLVNVANEILNKKKEKNLTYIYSELKKVNKKVTEEQVDKLVHGNRIIAGYTWFKLIIEVAGLDNLTQMKNDKYDETSFEQLADNFAARFNYGRQLMTGLDKLHSTEFSYEKNRSWIIFAELRSFITYFGGAALTIGLFSISIPASLFMCMIVFLMLFTDGENFKDYTYDELKIRYKRSRHQYVEMLKRMDLDKKIAANIIEDIYALDEIINNTYQYSTLFNKLSNLLFSTNRNAINSIKEQQLLEDLVHNDLFIKSAQLKTI